MLSISAILGYCPFFDTISNEINDKIVEAALTLAQPKKKK